MQCVLDVGTKLTTQDAGAVAAVLQAFVSHDAELPVEALLRSWSDQVHANRYYLHRSVVGSQLDVTYSRPGLLGAVTCILL